jgi:hypothetical protein
MPVSLAGVDGADTSGFLPVLEERYGLRSGLKLARGDLPEPLTNPRREREPGEISGLFKRGLLGVGNADLE